MAANTSVSHLDSVLSTNKNKKTHHERIFGKKLDRLLAKKITTLMSF